MATVTDLRSLLFAGTLLAAAAVPGWADPVSLSLQDTEVREVMEMLSRTERVNILLADGVGGRVSLNLYDMPLNDAIHAIAGAAGYAVETRKGAYFVLPREDVGRHADGGVTDVRVYKVQYTDPQRLEEILARHVSVYGQVMALPERNMLVLQDRPEFLERMDRVVQALDREPRQILITAQILEISLDDTQSYGIDWRRFFDQDDVTDVVGTQGLSQNSRGFFLEVLDDELEIFLDALVSEGKARTLSSPKLLALEGQEAEVIVGDRKGYRETTTINEVTTESVRFLESGVILRVTPSVDGRGRILMDVEPEISSGTITDGLPTQTATSVTTTLLLENGQTTFMGGLIKRTLTESRAGVPLLRRVPALGRLFENQNLTYANTETVVLITPLIIEPGDAPKVLEEHDDSYRETVELLDQHHLYW